ETVPVRCGWAATGNDPTLSSEIARRAVRVRLDTGSDDPTSGRDFKIPDLLAWLRQRRAELVWACLVLTRAWIAKRRPQGDLVLASFESWSRVMGGILQVAGIPGFLDPIVRYPLDGT